MYDSVAGRFCSKDPIGYRGGSWGLYEYVGSNSLRRIDPSGLEVCTIKIFAGHNFEVVDMIDSEVGDDDVLPDEIFIGGVGCAIDLGGESIEDVIGEKYPCNSIPDFPNVNGVLTFQNAPKVLETAFKKAQAQANNLCKKKPKPSSSKCSAKNDCDSVTIEVVCSPDMHTILDTGVIKGEVVPVTPFQKNLCKKEKIESGNGQNSFTCP
jgi:hypothetical protein